MNCPVCDRKLAPTLSICPACGAMMNDSVREELQPKIIALRDRPIAMSFVDDEPVVRSTMAETSSVVGEASMLIAANAVAAGSGVRMAIGNIAVGAGASYPAGSFATNHKPSTEFSAVPCEPVLTPTERPVETSELRSAKTSPTLVGFQNRNATEPDWKIQLRSAVQKRRGVVTEMPSASNPEQPTTPVAERRTPTNVDLDAITANAVVDPRVAKALERIERSKQKFAAESKHKTPSPPLKFRPVAYDQRPASVGSRIDTLPVIERRANVTPIAPSIAARDFDLPVIQPSAFHPSGEPDTNKLPPIETIISDDRVLRRIEPIDDLADEDHAPITMQEERLMIDAIDDEDDEEYYADELDDLAPIPMRFGAGLFDVIFAVTGTGIVILPFILFGLDVSTLFGSVAAFLTFVLTTFVYCTASIAFFERTIGMRLFGLELVDAAENEPPTLKQAAINSALFVGSLLTAGLGFATIAVNPERRAFHDIASGTILVREF